MSEKIPMDMKIPGATYIWKKNGRFLPVICFLWFSSLPCYLVMSENPPLLFIIVAREFLWVLTALVPPFTFLFFFCRSWIVCVLSFVFSISSFSSFWLFIYLSQRFFFHTLFLSSFSNHTLFFFSLSCSIRFSYNIFILLFFFEYIFSPYLFISYSTSEFFTLITSAWHLFFVPFFFFYQQSFLLCLSPSYFPIVRWFAFPLFLFPVSHLFQTVSLISCLSMYSAILIGPMRLYWTETRNQSNSTYTFPELCNRLNHYQRRPVQRNLCSSGGSKYSLR